MVPAPASQSIHEAVSFELSIKAKDSIKTALAMTIAYAIALLMDWDRPYWAAFAVAFVSLTTVGQSVNKAALRMSGTLLAMAVSLIIISLTAQNRWLFIVLLSLFTSLCAYKMGGQRASYFWQVSGFVTAIICFDSGPDPTDAFNTAIMRGQETGMGILVYTLVALFLWPNSSRAAFFESTATLTKCQTEAFLNCVELAQGRSTASGAAELEAAELQAQNNLAQLLLAAEADTSEVIEQKAGWRQFKVQSTALTAALQHWRDSLSEISHQQLMDAFPNLESFNGEISERLKAIGDMQAQRPPSRQPAQVTLPADLQVVEALSHYDRAGLAVARAHMRDVEKLTRDLFTTAARLWGFSDQNVEFGATTTQVQFALPDRDRLIATARFAVMQWTAFLAVIYIGDLPGGFGFVTMVTALGIAVVQMPGFKVRTLSAPTAYAIAFSGIVYLLVMPQLSSYLQLAPVIFAATFAICYLNHAPQQMLGRALGLALFSVICAISNDQSYSFISVATTAMMFSTLFVLLAVANYFPFSMRPEDVFLRMLKRFFRSAQIILAAVSEEPRGTATPPAQWLYAFHVREVATLPQKMAAWAAHLNPENISANNPQQIQTLTAKLQLLSIRLNQLTKLQADTGAAAQLHLQADLQDWREQMNTTLAEFALPNTPEPDNSGSAAPTSEPGRQLRVKLAGTDGDILNSSEAQEVYQLLGAHRGVAEALNAYGELAQQINWQALREPRFA
jgi:uncharacterized membrane protein YccC